MIVCIITAFVIVIDEFILPVMLTLHIEWGLTWITAYLSLPVIIVAVVVVLLLVRLLVIGCIIVNLCASNDFFVLELILCRLSYVSSILFVLISSSLVLCFVLRDNLSLHAHIFDIHELIAILRLIKIGGCFIDRLLSVAIVCHHPFCLLIVIVVVIVLHVLELSLVFFIWRVVFFIERVSRCHSIENPSKRLAFLRWECEIFCAILNVVRVFCKSRKYIIKT